MSAREPRGNALPAGVPAVLVVVAVLVVAACTAEPDSMPLGSTSPSASPAAPRIELLATPAGPHSVGPWLVASTPSRDGGGRSGEPLEVLLSWLEPLPDRAGEHAMRLARLLPDRSGWQPPVTVDEGADFWPNWADVSAVAPLGDGWVAHRLRTLAEGTYDYGIQLLRSEDGSTWRRDAYLHDDLTPAEHGFVSYVGLPSGDVQAFWLDGREMPDGGAMTLRSARVGSGALADEVAVDERVCECCPTSAAPVEGGAVVVYRNRSVEELRDIWIARLTDGQWQEPRPVHEDGWEINGCPVNGPVVTTDGRRTVWVAWYTVHEGTPLIRAALSRDGGDSFDGPIELDEGRVLGRVAAVADGPGDGAWVAWLTRESEEGGRLRLAHLRPDEGIVAESDLLPISSSRRSGYPQMVQLGDDELLLAWTEVDDDVTRVVSARVLSAPGGD